MEALNVFLQIGSAFLNFFGIGALIVSFIAGVLFLWLFDIALKIFRK